VRRNARTVPVAVGLATFAVAGATLLAKAGPQATASTVIGIGKNASLAELYAFLQVSPPPSANWTPILRPEECSMDWVLWSDGSVGDPLPPDDEKICLGRWRATHVDQCRGSHCDCEVHTPSCQSGRILTDVCMTSANCANVLFQKNIPSPELPAEHARCRQNASDHARMVAEGGPYHYWSRLVQMANGTYVCEAKYMAAKRRILTAPNCGCQQRELCECGRRPIATPDVGSSQTDGILDLLGLLGTGDSLADIKCETLQQLGALPVSDRYNEIVAGRGTTDPLSRQAFEYTQRLMHELDLVRPTAEDFMQSTLAAPLCGVERWLTVAEPCRSQVPDEPFLVSNNCARLLSSHVVSPTITDEVFMQCTAALATISQAPYSDTTCRDDIKEEIAFFSTALLDKAIGAPLAGSAAAQGARK
jgi:hypothetical protein